MNARQMIASPKIKYGKYTSSNIHLHSSFYKVSLEPLEKSNLSESKDAKDDSNNFFGINKKLYRKSDSFQNPKT